MTKAEADLGYSKSGIKGFFKPFIGKIVKNDRNRSESVDETPLTYKPSEQFKSADYFGGPSSSHPAETDSTTEEN